MSNAQPPEAGSLEERLRRTLRVKGQAARFTPAGSVRFTDEPVVETKFRVPRARMFVVSAAAVVLTVGAIVAVVAARDNDPARVVTSESTTVTTATSATTTSAPTTTTSAPAAIGGSTLRDATVANASVFAPTTAPAGTELYGMSSQKITSQAFPTQLFGTVGADGTLAPGVLFEFQHAQGGEQLGGGSSVTVRGQHASTFHDYDKGATAFQINWIERNTLVQAAFRGVTEAQAVTALNGFHPRGADLFDGFAPSPVPAGFALLHEVDAAHASPTSTEGVFRYGTAAAPKSGVLVATETMGAFPGYDGAWIGGTRQADGSVVAVSPGINVTVAWPDGHQVRVLSDGDSAPLVALARSVRLFAPDEATSLAHEVSDRVAALPLLGDARVGPVDVELRGHGAPAAICARVAADERVCSIGTTLPPLERAGAKVGAVLRGDQMIVFASGDLPPTIAKQVWSDPELPSDRAVIAGKPVDVATVPADVNAVQLEFPWDATHWDGAGLLRP